MTTQTVETISPQNISANRNGNEAPVEPIVIRLDNMPATYKNRLRILERVRRMNGALEKSGTPFRLRLL